MNGWTSPGGSPEAQGPPPAPSSGTPAGPPAPGPAQHPGWGQPPGWTPAPPAARPGIVPLRPLRLGEIYDGAFQAVRSNPGAMVGAAAVVVTVMTAFDIVFQVIMTGSLAALLEDALGGLETDPSAGFDVDPGLLTEAVGTTSLTLLVTQLVTVVGLALLTAIATLVVGSAVLGRRTTGGELWAKVRGRLLPLIGLTLLVGLLTVAVLVVALAPGLLALLVSEVLAVILLVLGAIAGILLVVGLDTRLSLAGPALLLEEQRVVPAIRRSWLLSSRGFLRLLGIRVLTALIVFVTTAIVAAPFQLVAAFFAPATSDPFAALTPTLLQLLVMGLGSAIASTIVYPFFAAVTALLYVDQRMRLEGLDVELARAAAEER